MNRRTAAYHGMVTTMNSATAVAERPAPPTRKAALARARLERLPIDGQGSPTIRQQGRQLPGTPEALADLISSISAVGILHPVLCERLPDNTVWLIAGERRLRAARHIITADPSCPPLADGLHTLVVPGPLTEIERRDLQLIENVARVDLSPTELARALLLDRAALLAQRLTEASVEIPVAVLAIIEPVERFRALDEARVAAGAHHIGAPWEEVIERLGLELSKSRAQQFVKAFTAIPPDITSQMDEENVTLNSRLGWTRLARNRRELADGIWEHLKNTDRPELLPAAVDAALADPDLDVEGAVEAAIANRAAGNHARREAAQRRNTQDAADQDAADPAPGPAHQGPPTDPNQPGLSDLYDAGHLIRELEQATSALRKGAHLDPRQTRSLKGLVPTLAAQLGLTTFVT